MKNNNDLLRGVTSRIKPKRPGVARGTYTGEDPHVQGAAKQTAPVEGDLRCERCKGFRKDYKVATDNLCICRPGDELLD